VKVPKDQDPKDLSLEECEEMIENAPIRRGRFGTKKKTTTKKAEEVKVDEVKADEVKADEVKADEVKVDEVKTDEVKTDEVKTEKTPRPLCSICGSHFDARRYRNGYKYCVSCADKVTEPCKGAEPLGSREDFKKMSGRSWSNSKKDKIT